MSNINKLVQFITESAKPELNVKLDLIDVKKYFPIDLRFLKKYSNSNKILLNAKVVKALLKAKKSLPKGWTFKIMYGYRSLKEQINIITITEKELKKSHPKNWEELLDKYTGGYKDLKETKISFMNHRSGNAVDLKLMNGRKEIDLGGSEASLSSKDKLNYYEKKKNLSIKDTAIRDNRRIFSKALLNQFKNYKDEWWHWGYFK